jgi:DNA-binding NarL/FixJ family response regulator
MEDFTTAVDSRLDSARIWRLLTPRQVQVIWMMVGGYSGPSIAKKLNVSHQAVYAMRKRARQTLHNCRGSVCME